MKQHGFLMMAPLVSLLIGVGCNVSPGGGGGSETERLLAVSGRAIPEGGALAFILAPQAERRVNISVQADTNRAAPDFVVVVGEVDFQDLDEVPFGDFVITSADNRSPGQASDHFTPEEEGPYTIFITDDNEWEGARLSVTITQRK